MSTRFRTLIALSISLILVGCNDSDTAFWGDPGVGGTGGTDGTGGTGGTCTLYWADRQGTQVQQLLRLETKPDGVSSLFAEVPRMSDSGNRIFFSALAPYSNNAPDNGWKLFLRGRL